MNRAMELIQDKKFGEARAVVEEMQPADIAAVFEELDSEQTIMLFRLLPKETAAEAFAYMTPEVQERVLTALTDVEVQTGNKACWVKGDENGALTGGISKFLGDCGETYLSGECTLA